LRKLGHDIKLRIQLDGKISLHCKIVRHIPSLER
jgi:hypothetical protein